MTDICHLEKIWVEYTVAKMIVQNNPLFKQTELLLLYKRSS